MSGVAPPPSRKLIFEGIPLLLVESMLPLKNWARETAVPLTIPSAKIPGTIMPTLGMV